VKIDIENVGDYGHDLNRPECVLCVGSGDLFVSHKGVGVTHIAPGGRQRIIGGARDVDGHELVPNGIALLPDRSFLIANIGEAGGVWRLQADGTITPYLIEVDGERLVADGCSFTNELRLAADGRSVYVSETFGRCISRFAVRADGSLGAREDFVTFGHGTFPDGIAFDEEDHLWVTSIVSNRLIRIAPNGSSEVLLEDSVAEHVDTVERALAEGRMAREHFYTMQSRKLRNISSIAFGGADRRTVYLGSLMGTSLATLHSPVPGRKPVHWDYLF